MLRIALILLVGSTSYATAQIPLPPVKYDRPYTGKLTVKRIHPNAMSLQCGWGAAACAFGNGPGSCTIILPNSGWSSSDMARLWRHEIGHCNGWPANHPGGRYGR